MQNWKVDKFGWALLFLVQRDFHRMGFSSQVLVSLETGHVLHSSNQVKLVAIARILPTAITLVETAIG
jgi:hypothetical protein